MKKADVKCGALYRAKVRGTVEVVRVTREHEKGGWWALVLSTQRPVRIGDPARLLCPCDRNGKAVDAPVVPSSRLPGERASEAAMRLSEPDVIAGRKAAKAKAAVPAKAKKAKGGTKKAAKKAAKPKQVPRGHMVRTMRKERKAAAAKAAAAKDPKADAAAAAGAAVAKAGKAKGKISGLDAAVLQLAKIGKPEKSSVVVAAMMKAGLWSSAGKTPEATIYAAIIREIAAKGVGARFAKTGPGTFRLTKVGEAVAAELKAAQKK